MAKRKNQKSGSKPVRKKANSQPDTKKPDPFFVVQDNTKNINVMNYDVALLEQMSQLDDGRERLLRCWN